MDKKIIETRLLEGCLAGNTNAQEELYDYFSPKMFGICLRYAPDYHIAEDILQEGFIKVFRNLSKFRREGSFEGWIRRIFVNTSIEYFRKVSVASRFIEIENVYEKAIDESVLHDLGRQDLLQLVQKLPDGYRLIFNLYCIEGYNHKEIAHKLKIKEGTSKSQLARSRNYLQRLIQERIENEEKTTRRARRLVPGFTS